jgi:hypothetical protein
MQIFAKRSEVQQFILPGEKAKKSFLKLTLNPKNLLTASF